MRSNFNCVALALLLMAGCQSAQDLPRAGSGDANGQQPGAKGEGQPRVAEVAPPVDDSGEGAGDAEDAGKQRLKNPLMRGLSQLADAASSILNDETGAGDVTDGLAEADQTFSKIKRDNAEAIRQANRPPQIGGVTAPHILLILADDLGCDDLACYGQDRTGTPRIDQIASEGALFSSFYAGAPDGPTSRWCLLTGMDTSRASERSGSGFSLRPEQLTVAEVLWKGGYTTAFIGKWGLATSDGMPHLHGFEQWYGTLDDDDDIYPETLWSDGKKVRVKANADGKQGVPADAVFTEAALTYIERHKRGAPFFLVVSYPLPRAGGGERQGTSGDDKAAAMARLDQDVGQLLDQLQRQGLRDKTAVFLTSDNSPHPGGTPSADRDLYEGALRVPLVARWSKGISKGQEIKDPYGMWDLLPTFADLASAPRRGPTDGISLLPALRGKQGKQHDMLYWEDRRHGFAQAVRMGEWKVVRRAGQQRLEDIELYNLARDPAERMNLADQRPDIVAKFVKQ